MHILYGTILVMGLVSWVCRGGTFPTQRAGLILHWQQDYKKNWALVHQGIVCQGLLEYRWCDLSRGSVPSFKEQNSVDLLNHIRRAQLQGRNFLSCSCKQNRHRFSILPWPLEEVISASAVLSGTRDTQHFSLDSEGTEQPLNHHHTSRRLAPVFSLEVTPSKN